MIEVLQFEFMRNAFIAALLASVACGIIGTYVVTKKIVSMSGGISHCAFGGIGLGYLLKIDPMITVIPFSILSALGMGIVTKKTKLPEDTAIGIFWAVAMALGVIFISLAPGYAPDLFSYLFGNILTVPSSDILMMLVLDLIIIFFVVGLYKEFLAISFDEEYATILNLPVFFLYLLLLGLIALTVVVMIRIVGVILVIALLTLPAAIARQFTGSLKMMMFLSTIISAVFSVSGLLISYYLNLPSGATIILLLAVVFIILFSMKSLLSKRMTSR